VSEDAYELLKKMKLKGESFTETIRRLAKRRRLADWAVVRHLRGGDGGLLG